jgi:hypothetical protein
MASLKLARKTCRIMRSPTRKETIMETTPVEIPVPAKSNFLAGKRPLVVLAVTALVAAAVGAKVARSERFASPEDEVNPVTS